MPLDDLPYLKCRHVEGAFKIDGYGFHRKDRVGRRSGGVAIYAKENLIHNIWTPRSNSNSYELLWVRMDHCSNPVFIGALYHPPKPIYVEEKLIEHIDDVIEEIQAIDSCSLIVLAGDMNKLPISKVQDRTGFIAVVKQPTRGNNILDQILVSAPCYDHVRVISSVVKTDHKAVLVESHNKIAISLQKLKQVQQYRRRSPAQHARFYQHLATFGFAFEFQATRTSQENFDQFYSSALTLMNNFYPQKSICISRSTVCDAIHQSSVAIEKQTDEEGQDRRG